jgi:hypothetical protein
MSGDADAPSLAVESRRAGTRPHAWVRRLSRATVALLTTTFAAMIALSWIYPTESQTPPGVSLALGFAILTAMAMAAAALLTQIVCWVGPRSRALLSVDSTGVRVGGSSPRVIPHASIESAWTLRESDGARVELQLDNGDVFSATTATPDEATAVLDAAAVDPSRRALRMPLGGAATRIGVGLVAAIPAACASSAVAVAVDGLLRLPSAALGFLIFTLFTVGIAAAVRLFSPPVVSVGRDGLSVRGGYASWFVTFGEIGHVVYGRNEVTLLLRDGRTRRIATYGATAARREALYARIAAGVEASRATLDLSARLATLDRNGRPVEEWRAALVDLTDARDGYRHTDLTRAEVQGALDDPNASPERRIGAAYALAAMDPDGGVTRVRVVAETVANEPVRVALERAAEGTLDEASLDAVNKARE